MNKGIVMELSERHVIVMTSGGVFRKLPRDGRTCDMGEEILFAEPLAARKAPPMAKLSGLVAAVVMCIVVIAIMTRLTGNAEVVAYVSMDINPSVEFGIDSSEKVLDLKGLNDDGTKLIAGIDYKNKMLEAVTDVVLQRAEDQGPLARGEGDIVIASSIVKNTDKISDTAIADKLKEQVTKHIKAKHPNQADQYEVTAFAAPQEIRQAAAANGLSMGKYAIYLNAKGNGTPVVLDDLKRESVHELAKQNGGIEAFMNPKQPPAKGVFKQLLDEEKSGKLDERVKQFAEQRSRDSGNVSGGKKSDDKTISKPDAKNDSKKNEPARVDNKNGKTQTGKKDQSKDDNSKNGNNRNGNNNSDDNKNTNGKPSSGKPAGGTNSSEQDIYINSGNSDNKKDDNKKDSRKDDKSNDEKKSSASKSGVTSGNNDKKEHGSAEKRQQNE